MRENCWNATGCGMQPGGEGAKLHGTCPAVTAAVLDGANGGKNGGRACWVVDGTSCGGEAQGSFVEKLNTCRGCEFHARVRKEEGGAYVPSRDLLGMLRGA